MGVTDGGGLVAGEVGAAGRGEQSGAVPMGVGETPAARAGTRGDIGCAGSYGGAAGAPVRLHRSAPRAAIAPVGCGTRRPGGAAFRRRSAAGAAAAGRVDSGTGRAASGRGTEHGSALGAGRASALHRTDAGPLFCAGGARTRAGSADNRPLRRITSRVAPGHADDHGASEFDALHISHGPRRPEFYSGGALALAAGRPGTAGTGASGSRLRSACPLLEPVSALGRDHAAGAPGAGAHA